MKYDILSDVRLNTNCTYNLCNYCEWLLQNQWDLRFIGSVFTALCKLQMKAEALELNLWRNRFGIGYGSVVKIDYGIN